MVRRLQAPSTVFGGTMKAVTDRWPNYLDDDWLGLVQEDPIDPEVAIVDPHFHLMSDPFCYDLHQWVTDMNSGHKVIATVHAQAGQAHHRTAGPDHLKPVGETEFLLGVIEAADRLPGAPPVCTGIIGGGDLTRSAAAVADLLDAHIAVGGERFKGVRVNLFWSYAKDGSMMAIEGSGDLAERLLAGVNELTARNLSLDLICYHSNLLQVAHIAASFPRTTVVVNHLGTIVDTRPSPAARQDMIDTWREGIDALASHPNVHMKLGGCANPIVGHSMPEMLVLRDRSKPPSSEELAEAYGPWVEYVIDRLGPKRCMFESNFPLDKTTCSYRTLWNAFKRLSRRYAPEARRALLSQTAADTYRLAI
jgi:predicted TIM-barrel fold metal-dependent hydrolase